MNDNPLELYEAMEGWKEASNDILAILKIARNQYQTTKDADVAYAQVSQVLHKYSPWGAEDSEPCWAAAKIFCRGFPELDPDDFYSR